MTNAQDQALLDLARRRGLLDSEAVLALDQAVAAEPGAPMAHLLLNRGDLPAGSVAILLRNLAQGTYVCESCAERLPYYALAELATLACPLCGARLCHAPNPRPIRRPTLAVARRRRPAQPVQPVAPTVREPILLDRIANAPPRPGTTDLPRRLGEWVLLGELGRGANGVVFRARRHGEPDRALKVLHPLMTDPESLARFRIEASLARKLDHPGIVPVLSAGRRGGSFFCAMELCPGGTLRDLLRRQRLDLRTATALVAQVADAIGAAHAQGIIHRDLKPANILFDGQGRPRVTDFGLARDPSLDISLTQPGQVLGTPTTMSPEQLLGLNVDARADVYALGVILYECLTGALPHQAPSLVALAEQVLHVAPHAPRVRAPNVPAALEAVCLKALSKDAADRFADANALRRALRPWV